MASKMDILTAVAAAVLLVAFQSFTVVCQDMQPRVYITETDPPSDGLRMRGFLAKDAWLNCFVENLVPELSVRWDMFRYRNGKEEQVSISIDMSVEDNIKWSIEKPTQYSWRLRIKALAVQDEGNYTCYVILTNNNNRAEANRTVFVTDPPLILEAESSSDITVKEGDFVPLRCNASGRPQPTVIWRRQGNAILPAGGVRHIGSIFDINNIQYNARGNYICEGFNEVGYDRRDIFIGIQHSPKIFPDPDRLGQAVGYQRTLICHIEASPVPSIDPETNQLYWSFESQRLVPDDRRMIRILEGAYGRLTFELVILKTRSVDYGMYKCHARNTIGDAVEEVEFYETEEPQEDKQGIISLAHHMHVTMATIVMSLCVWLMHFV